MAIAGCGSRLSRIGETGHLNESIAFSFVETGDRLPVSQSNPVRSSRIAARCLKESKKCRERIVANKKFPRFVMSFNFSFVRGNSFTLELPESETVATAKRLIHAQYPTVLLETVKLIFRSQILADDVQFSSLGLFPNDVIIVQPRALLPKTPPVFDENPPEAAFQPPAQAPAPAPAPATPEPISPQVAQLMEMGFGQAESADALRRAGNVQAAAELLTDQAGRQQPNPAHGGYAPPAGPSVLQVLRPIAPNFPDDILMSVYQGKNGDLEAAKAELREMNGG
jgi:hypothetical protein